MRFVFHPAALTEYSEAVQYYSERRSELAQAFINAVGLRNCDRIRTMSARLAIAFISTCTRMM